MNIYCVDMNIVMDIKWWENAIRRDHQSKTAADPTPLVGSCSRVFPFFIFYFKIKKKFGGNGKRKRVNAVCVLDVIHSGAAAVRPVSFLSLPHYFISLMLFSFLTLQLILRKLIQGFWNLVGLNWRTNYGWKFQLILLLDAYIKSTIVICICVWLCVDLWWWITWWSSGVASTKPNVDIPWERIKRLEFEICPKWVNSSPI